MTGRLAQKALCLEQRKQGTSGLFAIDIVSPDTPILIKITGGYYFEEASGKQIQLDRDLGHQLTAVAYYISGQQIIISTTFFSTLAHGLAEHYIASNTFSVSNAIIEANRIMTNWAGFDTATTTPLDVANVANITTSSNISDGHKYGYVSAAISKLTYQIHVDSNVDPHTAWPSIQFIQLAYQDIQDGVMDGKANGTQLMLGLMKLDANIYRDILAARLLQFTLLDKNKAGLTFNDLKPFASQLNTVSGTIFNNTVAPDITTNTPTIEMMTPPNSTPSDPPITTTSQISAIINSEFPLIRSEFFIDNSSVFLLTAPLPTTSTDDLNAPSFVLDAPTLKLAETVHELKLETTNEMGNKATLTNTFYVSYTTPRIDSLKPVTGQVSGDIKAEVVVTDSYGLASVRYSITDTTNHEIFGVDADMTTANYLATINSLLLPNGSFTFLATVTNNVDKSSTISSIIEIANGKPVVAQVPFSTNMTGTDSPRHLVCDPVPFTVTDINNTSGFQKVVVTYNSSGAWPGPYGTTTIPATLNSTTGNVSSYSFRFDPVLMPGTFLDEFTVIVVDKAGISAVVYTGFVRKEYLVGDACGYPTSFG